MTTNLYIIGNGFDIHHGISTRYSNFKEFVKINSDEIYDLIENYIVVDEQWCELEESLATLDIEQIIDDNSCFLPSYSSDDWRESGHHDFEYEIENIISSLTSGLRDLFTQWIKEVQFPSLEDSEKLKIDKSSFFLSFNYTETLEEFYQIKNENILYIHGCRKAKNENLILGHACDPASIKLVETADCEEMDTRLLSGYDLLSDYFSKTFKPTSTLINDNQPFFNSLHKINSIYILGHSLSFIDLPYFEEITKKINTKTTKWFISYYNDHEKTEFRKTISSLGIPSNNVSINKIEKIF